MQRRSVTRGFGSPATHSTYLCRSSFGIVPIALMTPRLVGFFLALAATGLASSSGCAPSSESEISASLSYGDVSSGDTSTAPPMDKFVGNITTRGEVRSDFMSYWDQLTPENESKWSSIEPSRDVMNWEALDRAYDFARRNGIPFKGHTFVWGSQYPRWIAGLPPEEQREEVEEWIRLFCERYPDTEMIDVVNEPPPHTTPPYMDAIGGAGATGYDWIVWSFERARHYCPNSILILNDYNVLVSDTVSFLRIVGAVQDSGYIDALGAQGHNLEAVSITELRSNLSRVLRTGLPLYVSEYDLNIADDAEQRKVMSQQFPLFYEEPQITGITLWGYIHGFTWKTDTGLIRDGVPRPALTWLMEYLGR